MCIIRTRCMSSKWPLLPPCSALRDRRFEPVAHRELAALSCTVSLLFAFEAAASWLDWAVGTHGLIIDFYGARLPRIPAFPVPQCLHASSCSAAPSASVDSACMPCSFRCAQCTCMQVHVLQARTWMSR